MRIIVLCMLALCVIPASFGSKTPNQPPAPTPAPVPSIASYQGQTMYEEESDDDTSTESIDFLQQLTTTWKTMEILYPSDQQN